MPKLQKTPADYIAIAISPALIMVLVGSLVFFLAAVFYQGQYPTRLNIILGLFVFASVLIARHSIEQGRAHAIPFALALAAATGFALFRFVEYQGELPQGFTTIVNLTLMVVVWWSADKLTYDCTVIEDHQKASTEGLMQTIGFDDEPARGQRAKQKKAAQPEENQKDEPAETSSDNSAELSGTTSRESEEKPRSWWDRHVDRKGRPHSPGLWVVYFSLAALPIFGFGQGLIPSEDVDTRRWVFWLFCAYMAAGLGLLISTSFLGLRRYLRQRKVEMPSSMAGWWLVTGSLLVLGLLLVTALLPRPAAEYAVSDWSLKATSPVTSPSNFAMGGEGVETKNSGRGKTNTRQQPNENSPEVNGQENNGNQRNANQGNSERGDQAGNNQGDQSNQNSDNKSGNQNSNQQANNSGQQNNNSGDQQDDQSNRNSQSSGNQSDQQSGNRDNSGSQSSNQQDNGNDDQNKDAQNADGQQGNRQQGDGDSQSQDNDQDNDQGNNRNNADDRGDQQQGRANNNAGGSGRGANSPDENQDANENEDEANNAGAGQAEEDTGGSGSGSGRSFEGETASSTDSPDFESQSWFDDVDWLTTGFKWLIYLIVGIILLFVLVRYGKDIFRGFREFFVNLKNFFLGLFGGGTRKTQEAVAAQEQKPQGPPPRPFSTYADPFSSGMADKVPPQELVRYSFEAFEAWARDSGRPRGEEETPYEFANDVARASRHVAKDARNLADLYDRAAYAPSGVSSEKALTLSGLWDRLRGVRKSASAESPDQP